VLEWIRKGKKTAYEDFLYKEYDQGRKRAITFICDCPYAFIVTMILFKVVCYSPFLHC
jgi:hypothetical protein